MGELLVDNKLLRFGFSFGKFYFKKILDDKKIRFIEGIQYGEDLIFFVTYLNQINKVKFIREALYHYFISSTVISLSKNHNSFQSELKGFNNFKKVCDDGFLK